MTSYLPRPQTADASQRHSWYAPTQRAWEYGAGPVASNASTTSNAVAIPEQVTRTQATSNYHLSPQFNTPRSYSTSSQQSQGQNPGAMANFTNQNRARFADDVIYSSSLPTASNMMVARRQSYSNQQPQQQQKWNPAAAHQAWQQQQQKQMVPANAQYMPQQRSRRNSNLQIVTTPYQHQSRSRSRSHDSLSSLSSLDTPSRHHHHHPDNRRRHHHHYKAAPGSRSRSRSHAHHGQRSSSAGRISHRRHGSDSRSRSGYDTSGSNATDDENRRSRHRSRRDDSGGDRKRYSKSHPITPRPTMGDTVVALWDGAKKLVSSRRN